MDTTKVQVRSYKKNSKYYKNFSSTVPMFIIEHLKVNKGNTLVWSIEDNKVYINKNDKD